MGDRLVRDRALDVRELDGVARAPSGDAEPESARGRRGGEATPALPGLPRRKSLDALARGALSDPDPRVLRDFARLAPIYDRLWARYVGVSIRRTLDLVRLSGSERVLDIGCGTGVLLAALARNHPQLRLVGLDASPEMLARAEVRVGSAALDLGSAADLPYDDGAFDLVVSTSVLHSTPGELEPILAEWRRVLAPGGALVVTDWRARHPGTWAYNAALTLAGRGQRPLAVQELVAALDSVDLETTALEEFRVDGWGLVSVRAEQESGVDSQP